MAVTDSGIVMERIPLPENAPPSIDVTPLGTVREEILLHPENAPLPIIFVFELIATLDLPTGTIIRRVSDELYRQPPSDA